MTVYALLFTLAAIGISEAFYLVQKRKNDQHPVCFIGGGCQVVLDSKYNSLFGIHNDIIGFLFYTMLSVVLGLIVVGVEPMEWWTLFVKVSVAGAALFSVFLTIIQIKVIKHLCFWCLMSAVTTWLMALIILLTNLL